MRNKFDIQLMELSNKLITMGSLIETAIASASKSLTLKDRELALSVIEKDDEVDQYEKDIESFCLKLLLSQQPVAGDLRLISSVLKIITDMERIADQASDICEISLHLYDKEYIKKLENIPLMAEATVKMVTDSIDSFVKKDLAVAEQVIENDDIVDALFVKIKNNLIDLIVKDANNGEQALDLLMVAKYFERIGDHASNIAEWVIFSLTGEHKYKKVVNG